MCRVPTSAIHIHDSPLQAAAVRAVADAPAAVDDEEEILIVDETEEDSMVDGMEFLPVAVAGDAAADDDIIALPITEARSVMLLRLCMPSWPAADMPRVPYFERFTMNTPSNLIQNGVILPVDQVPEPEDEKEETPRAMPPPRAADALPKGAMANKPSLRLDGNTGMRRL